jgi:site-specific DNA-methyltransferase (adenine-specific)
LGYKIKVLRRPNAVNGSIEGMMQPYILDRIITGDARVLADEIPDDSIDLALLDPPFGIGFDYGDGYTDAPDEYPELVRWIVATCNRIVKPGGLSFVFQAQIRLRLTWPMFPDDSRLFSACKNFVQMQGDIPHAYDPVVFWRKPGTPLIKGKGRDYHVGNTANTNNRGKAEAGFHECPRPLDTIMYMVENFCPVGGIVCDLFAGSGTTAVAAKLLGRQFVGFELRAHVAEQARARVEKTQAMHPAFAVEQETFA